MKKTSNPSNADHRDREMHPVVFLKIALIATAAAILRCPFFVKPMAYATDSSHDKNKVDPNCLLELWEAWIWVTEAEIWKMIREGANVRATDYYGVTPLHYAAAEATDDVVDALLNAGADVEAKTRSGRTPLHWAVKNEWGVVPILIEWGADVNAQDKFQRTPLDYAKNQPLNTAIEPLEKAGGKYNSESDIIGDPSDEFNSL